MATPPKIIGKKPQNLLRKLFWKINLIKMMKILICEDTLITCCALLLFLLIRIWKECCGAPIRIVLQEDSRTVKDARIVQYEERNHTVKV